jgi:tetratricopeptide (TPR) repeat protein
MLAQFFLGLLWQRRGRAVANAEEKASAWAQAEKHYRATLALHPTSGGAMNNLAMILEEQKRFSEAEDLLERALELNDSRRAIIADTAGDLMARQGKAKRAARYYRMSLDAQDSEAVREKLLDQLLIHGKTSEDAVREAIDYLWAAWKAGHVTSALFGALRALEEGRHDGDETHVLFAIVAASLARKSYDAPSYRESDVAKQLEKIAAERPTLREAAKSIAGAYSGAAANREFWQERVSDDDAGPITPVEAYRQLLRAVAEHALQTSDAELAEKALSSAIGLDDSLDIASSTALLSLYGSLGRIDEVDQLVMAVEDRLPGTTEHQAAYDFHRVAGALYAAQKRWTNPRQPSASAIQQLTHAERARITLNENPRPAGIAEIPPDPNVKRQLAEAFREVGKQDLAIDATFEAADAYLRLGDRVSATYVAATVPADDVPKDWLAHYQSLVADGVSFDFSTPPWPAQDLRSTDLRAAVLAYVGSTTDTDRKKALGRLGALNIQHLDLRGTNGFVIVNDDARTRIPFKLTDAIAGGIVY